MASAPETFRTPEAPLSYRLGRRLQEYALLARLDRPIGTWLLLWPTLWALWVAGAGRPYWKVTELWECELTTPSGDGSVADQVLLCLLSAQRLASGWFVLGPLSAEGADGFSGVFALGQSGASSHVAGLEWASFQLGSGSKA